MERVGRGGRDWSAWHDGYDDPASDLSRRLRVVQRHIRESLDLVGSGRIRVVSVCAGQGRDLLGVLPGHPRRDDVEARLVELDASNAEVARKMARTSRLTGVEVVEGDASVTGAYEGAVPAELVLVCGLFGNISDADVERTVALMPRLCAKGADVIWTRHRRDPDLTPRICGWFAEHDFRQRCLSLSETGPYAVGTHRFTGEPMPLEPGARMFTFAGSGGRPGRLQNGERPV